MWAYDKVMVLSSLEFYKMRSAGNLDLYHPSTPMLSMLVLPGLPRLPFLLLILLPSLLPIFVLFHFEGGVFQSFLYLGQDSLVMGSLSVLLGIPFPSHILHHADAIHRQLAF